MSIYNKIKQFEGHKDIEYIDIERKINSNDFLISVKTNNKKIIDELSSMCFDVILDSTWKNYMCEIRNTGNIFLLSYKEV